MEDGKAVKAGERGAAGREGDDLPELLEAVWEASREKPVALVDCDEEIPCNPCETACPRGAISVGPEICHTPRLDLKRCDGCGRCVRICPGLAIVLLDRTVDPHRPRITLPHEMAWTPAVGSLVWAVDGTGRPIGLAEVVRVRGGGKGSTSLVTVEIEGRRALKIRGLRGRKKHMDAPEEMGCPPPVRAAVLCRCEELEGGVVRRVLELGGIGVGAVRRLSRVGLGVCQGRYCQDALQEEIRGFWKDREDRVGEVKVRPPVRPMKLWKLGSGYGRDP